MDHQLDAAIRAYLLMVNSSPGIARRVNGAPISPSLIEISDGVLIHSYIATRDTTKYKR